MRTSFSKLFLLALPLAALTACQDYEPFDEATVHAAMAAREFTNNFEQRYGKIDPNHDWGFGPLSATFDDSFIVTRGSGTGTEDNKNEWETVYHLQVPGWPDIYTDKDGVQHNNGFHKVGTDHAETSEKYYPANTSPRPSLETPGILPGGDVTDEEIQYVSWWFRTHYEPGRMPIHCSDYFIQEISSDNDRYVDPNLSTKDGYSDPTATVGNSDNIKYIQHKENGEWVNNTPNGTGTMDKFGLEQMMAANLEGKSSAGAQLPGYDDVKNFNQSDSNNYGYTTNVYCSNADTTKIWNDPVPVQDQKTGTKRNIQFYNTSGTEAFAVKCTQDTQWKDHYALVHLVFVGKSGRVYDGYYLGFDYEMNKITDNEGNAREYHAYDGYYSNWIVKLSPAEPKVHPNPFARRVMCEDLGNTFDFDFNDVVFDATYNVNSFSSYTEGEDIDVTITLRASGGTLPIYVGKNPQSRSAEDLAQYEAHHLMGQNTTSNPVNVGKNSKYGAISTYHITMNSSDPGDIGIWVENKGEYYNVANKTGLDKYNGGVAIKDENNANRSLAPQQFAVPVGTRWMQECEFIERAYPDFPEWVKDENYLNKDNGKPWYHNENIDPSGLLYLGGGDAGISGEISETPAGPDYSKYGTQITLFTDVDDYNNVFYSLPISSFEINKNYEVTILVELQNSGSTWQQSNFTLKMRSAQGWGEGNNLCTGYSTGQVDPNDDKSYYTKATLVMPSSIGNYERLAIESLGGIKKINAVCIKEVQ